MKNASGSKPINLKRALEERSIAERISRCSLMNKSFVLAHADANLTQNHNRQLQNFCGILKPPKTAGKREPVPRQRQLAGEVERQLLPPSIAIRTIRIQPAS